MGLQTINRFNRGQYDGVEYELDVPPQFVFSGLRVRLVEMVFELSKERKYTKPIF